MSRCYLEVGNGNEYPDIHFKPATDPARVFREVMSYVYANNDFQGGTLLNRSNFQELFPFVYFDLTKQKKDLKDGVTKHFIMNYLLIQTLIIIFTLWYFMSERQK